MSYKVTWEECNPTMSFSGSVVWREILAAYQEILGSACFDSIEYIIADYMDVTVFIGSEADMIHLETIVLSSTRWNNHVKNAQIAKLDNAVKLIHHYLKKMENSGWSCRLFSDREKAKKWCTG